MGRLEASYTVELTLLLPLIILAMFLPVYKAYDFFDEVKQDCAYVWQKDLEPEKKIRKIKFAKELWEDIKE